MTEEERYGMGWGSSDGGGGSTYYGDASMGGGHGSSARRCCPVCKAECSVRDVVPLYVRESDGNDGGAPGAAAVASTDDVDGIDESVSVTHQQSPAHTAAEATTIDPTALTGLRRRRGGGGAARDESLALGGGLAEDYARNDDDENLSISTISTEDQVNAAVVAAATSTTSNGATVTSRPSATSSDEIPSRPAPQPYLHQPSSSMGMRPSDSAEAPMTPLINNRQGQAGAAGVNIRRPPLSPPRGARPSSLSNGLSLSFWSGFVDALLGAQANAGDAAASERYVPPIHRLDNGRGPHRSAVSGVNNVAGGTAGHNRIEQGGLGATGESAPTSTTRGRRWFNPTFVDDSTTEFLSRLLLMLGCFVVFCLLLF